MDILPDKYKHTSKITRTYYYTLYRYIHACKKKYVEIFSLIKYYVHVHTQSMEHVHTQSIKYVCMCVYTSSL